MKASLYQIVTSQWGGGNRTLYLIDMVWCLLRYGAQPIDYTRFEFYKKSRRERNRYLTLFRYFKYVKKIRKELGADLMGNKIEEYRVFSKYIKRKWMPVTSDTSDADILSFCEQCGDLIAKPNNGEQGHGVFKIVHGDRDSINTLLRLKSKENFVLEEVVQNYSDIKRINASSLNTIRVTTFRDKNGKVHIISIILRAGQNGCFVDNWGSGGIGYNFDLEYGICDRPGKDKKNRPYIFHPGSDVQMIGFKLPRFEEMKQLVLDLCDVVPNAKYVGWDIALTPEGFDLIEMNSPAGHDMFQSFDNPVYKMFQKQW